MFKHRLTNFKFKTFPEELKQMNIYGVQESPLVSDGLKYYEVVYKYVSNYIDLYYPTNKAVTTNQELVAFWTLLGGKMNGLDKKSLSVENLKIVCTEVIFRVTAWHEHVGKS